MRLRERRGEGQSDDSDRKERTGFLSLLIAILPQQRAIELPKEETHTVGTRAIMKDITKENFTFSMHIERAHGIMSKNKFKGGLCRKDLTKQA